MTTEGEGGHSIVAHIELDSGSRLACTIKYWFLVLIQPLLSVEVLNLKTNKTETIEVGSIEDALQLRGETFEDSELDRVSMMLYVKDRYSISGSAYHEMAKLCGEMPRHYKVKNKIAELNKLWDIHPTPNHSKCQGKYASNCQEMALP